MSNIDKIMHSGWRISPEVEGRFVSDIIVMMVPLKDGEKVLEAMQGVRHLLRIDTIKTLATTEQVAEHGKSALKQMSALDLSVESTRHKIDSVLTFIDSVGPSIAFSDAKGMFGYKPLSDNWEQELRQVIENPLALVTLHSLKES